MALVDNAWYVNYGNGSSTGYYAVAQWAALTTYDCGNLIRQLAAPANGSERIFVCIAGHVASGAAEPAWTLTRGAKTTDATITWQEATGIAALNGDLSVNTPNWNIVKNTAITLGQVIQNVAGNLILICTTAGTAGNGAEPSWAAYTTAGATTADNTATWTTLGASFSAWASPHARIKNAGAANWGQVGNVFYVADNHAETASAFSSVTMPGTTASPNFIYCVDRTVSVPPGSSALKSSGSLSTTGAIAISLNGTYYCYGLTFSAGTSGAANLSINSNQIYEACKFVMGGASGTLGLGNTTTHVELINSTVKFPAATFSATPGGSFVWKNTTSAVDVSLAAPTTLFNITNIAFMICDGVDFSAVGTSLVSAGSAGRVLFKDCKLPAGPPASIAGAPTLGYDMLIVDAIRCDNAGTNYQLDRITPSGTLSTETTITRVGGASDGAQSFSRKIVTNSSPTRWLQPFSAPPIAIWNDKAGSSVTATVHAAASSLPNTDDIWIEATYLKNSTDTQGGFATNTKADNLASGSAYSSDGNTWNSSPGATFAMSATFTPQQKGYIYITVKCAKVSTTFYVDTLVALT